MLRRQRELWKSLTWYEWAMVLVAMIGSAISTKSWLQIIIYIVNHLT